jgi:hypothetical protein
MLKKLIYTSLTIPSCLSTQPPQLRKDSIDNVINAITRDDKLPKPKRLFTAFYKTGKKVIIIFNVCGVIETRNWIDEPDAALISWLPNQEGGNSGSGILTSNEVIQIYLLATYKEIDKPAREVKRCAKTNELAASENETITLIKPN